MGKIKLDWTKNWSYLKDEYLALPRIDFGYTFTQIQKLRDMAEHDIYPDGRFSDEECNLWSMFHMLKKSE